MGKVTDVGTLYLAWLDEEAADTFLLDCVLDFLRAFLGVKVEMLEVAKDLSRPTHFEQLGITVIILFISINHCVKSSLIFVMKGRA